MKFISILLALIVLVFSGAPAFAAGPWKGRVIDAETKAPLEGAVVLAVWDRNYRTPTGGSSYFYEAKEVLTDKDGYFEIPSYISINILPIISYIRGPAFTIFKPGYGSVNYGNNFGHLSIYAIGPSEIGYGELRWITTADGHAVEYAVSKRKKYPEGLIYSGKGCKERMAAVKETTPFTIDFFYIPMERAGEKIDKLDIPLDCPKDSEPVPHVDGSEGAIDEYVRNRSFRIVELPRLKTREERKEAVQLGFTSSSDVPARKKKNLIKLRNKEAVAIGLQPIYQEEE